MIFSSYSSYVYYLVAIVFFSTVAAIALGKDFTSTQKEDGTYPGLYSSIFFVTFMFIFVFGLGISAYNYFFYIGEEYEEVSVGRYEEIFSLKCKKDKYDITKKIKTYIDNDGKINNREYYKILELENKCKERIEEENSFFKKISENIDNYFIEKHDIKKEELIKSFKNTL